MKVLNECVHENLKKCKVYVDIAEYCDKHFTVSLMLGYALS